MNEKVTSRLGALAPTEGVVLFSAGVDPLDPETRFLVGWLAQRGLRCSIVDALSDPELSPALEAECARQRLPMLYVNGHLMGGGRLLKQLADSGQLGRLVEQPINRLPKIAASSLAIAQLKRALKSPTNVVRLTISDELCHDLCVDEVRPRDIELVIGELTLVLDQSSASRADGVAIDWIERPEGSGFRIDNSNVVAASRSVDCAFLAEWLAGPVPPLLIDARTEEEYLAGRLPEARLLDAELLDALLLLDRRTSLAFYCKNGTRSDRAARHHKELGFVDVATLAGGFDAWKRHFGQQRATSRL